MHDTQTRQNAYPKHSYRGKGSETETEKPPEVTTPPNYNDYQKTTPFKRSKEDQKHSRSPKIDSMRMIKAAAPMPMKNDEQLPKHPKIGNLNTYKLNVASSDSSTARKYASPAQLSNKMADNTSARMSSSNDQLNNPISHAVSQQIEPTQMVRTDADEVAKGVQTQSPHANGLTSVASISTVQPEHAKNPKNKQVKKREDSTVAREMRRSKQGFGNDTFEDDTKTRLEPRDLDSEMETDEYKMVSHLFDYQSLISQPSFGIKRYKNSLYKGILTDKKREGLGVLVYDTGRVYEGEWKHEKRNGRGFELYNNGSKYIGQFINNKAQGKGVYTWRNGEIYDGEWNRGKKHGFGIWKGIQGDSYIGEWRDGRVQGYGVHQWKNGDRYEGEWQDCLKHGQGTDIFANGDVYTGMYAYGKPSGFGQYKWKNGATYVGYFVEGLKHGSGKWKKDARPNCNQYDGEFLNDMKHGNGAFQWESGNAFKGNYRYDMREGYGEMFWNDGSIYKGNWHKGQQSGFGTLIMPDGRSREGIFKKNKYIGKGSPRNHGQPATIEEEQEDDEVQLNEKLKNVRPALTTDNTTSDVRDRQDDIEPDKYRDSHEQLNRGSKHNKSSARPLENPYEEKIEPMQNPTRQMTQEDVLTHSEASQMFNHDQTLTQKRNPKQVSLGVQAGDSLGNYNQLKTPFESVHMNPSQAAIFSENQNPHYTRNQSAEYTPQGQSDRSVIVIPEDVQTVTPVRGVPNIDEHSQIPVKSNSSVQVPKIKNMPFPVYDQMSAQEYNQQTSFNGQPSESKQFDVIMSPADNKDSMTPHRQDPSLHSLTQHNQETHADQKEGLSATDDDVSVTLTNNQVIKQMPARQSEFGVQSRHLSQNDPSVHINQDATHSNSVVQIVMSPRDSKDNTGLTIPNQSIHSLDTGAIGTNNSKPSLNYEPDRLSDARLRTSNQKIEEPRVSVSANDEKAPIQQTVQMVDQATSDRQLQKVDMGTQFSAVRASDVGVQHQPQHQNIEVQTNQAPSKVNAATSHRQAGTKDRGIQQQQELRDAGCQNSQKKLVDTGVSARQPTSHEIGTNPRSHQATAMGTQIDITKHTVGTQNYTDQRDYGVQIQPAINAIGVQRDPSMENVSVQNAVSMHDFANQMDISMHSMGVQHLYTHQDAFTQQSRPLLENKSAGPSNHVTYTETGINPPSQHMHSVGVQLEPILVSQGIQLEPVKVSTAAGGGYVIKTLGSETQTKQIVAHEMQTQTSPRENHHTEPVTINHVFSPKVQSKPQVAEMSIQTDQMPYYDPASFEFNKNQKTRNGRDINDEKERKDLDEERRGAYRASNLAAAKSKSLYSRKSSSSFNDQTIKSIHSKPSKNSFMVRDPSITKILGPGAKSQKRKSAIKGNHLLRASDISTRSRRKPALRDRSSNEKTSKSPSIFSQYPKELSSHEKPSGTKSRKDEDILITSEEELGVGHSTKLVKVSESKPKRKFLEPVRNSVHTVTQKRLPIHSKTPSVYQSHDFASKKPYSRTRNSELAELNMELPALQPVSTNASNLMSPEGSKPGTSGKYNMALNPDRSSLQSGLRDPKMAAILSRANPLSEVQNKSKKRGATYDRQAPSGLSNYRYNSSSRQSRPSSLSPNQNVEVPPRVYMPYQSFLPKIRKSGIGKDQKNQLSVDYPYADEDDDMLPDFSEQYNRDPKRNHAKMAANRAIEILMQSMKKEQKPIWVPNGQQRSIFHTNVMSEHRPGVQITRK